MIRSTALLLIVIAAGLGTVGCGDNSDVDDTTTTEETATTDETTTGETTAAGREVFVASCGGCHALSDAGTSGAVGPDLDAVEYSQDGVEAQVREGGEGMPAFEGELTDDEIEQVSAYVASS